MPDGLVWEFHRPLVVEEVVPDTDGTEGQVKTVELKGHVPGWRSILKRLALDELLITLPDCEKYFDVSRGRSSQKWQQAIN